MVPRLAVLVVVMLLVPFGLRLIDARYGADDRHPSYLPSLEAFRARDPFDPFHRHHIARLRPELVILGDSMAGTRIDPAVLAELSGKRVYTLLQAASGPAFWYLAIKNWIIPSGAAPKYVFVFFRDTNLTDVMFRLDETYRAHLDRAAHDSEGELDALVGARRGAIRSRATSAVEAAYGANRTRNWMVPAVGDRVARIIEPGRRRRQAFVVEMNVRLDYRHMRPVVAADIDAVADRDADFDRFIDRSVLPLMIRDAQQAGITLFFVRVQRRPDGGRPPRQSEALARYVARLREYVQAAGALWRDDTGDAAMTIDLYGDGDHLARDARPRYTGLFWNRVRPLLQ
ncbi:MAG TPA: hypothetical protein VNJ03_17785 [Vicinamibacterales bacterium]|nr:hypothetical protein [Vicinamibacterales bacterium]